MSDSLNAGLDGEEEGEKVGSGSVGSLEGGSFWGKSGRGAIRGSGESGSSVIGREEWVLGGREGGSGGRESSSGAGGVVASVGSAGRGWEAPTPMRSSAALRFAQVRDVRHCGLLRYGMCGTVVCSGK